MDEFLFLFEGLECSSLPGLPGDDDGSNGDDIRKLHFGCTCRFSISVFMDHNIMDGLSLPYSSSARMIHQNLKNLFAISAG